MAFSTLDIAHLLLALTVLLVAAHAGGTLATVLRQPRVVGEIVAGMALGPSLLGAVAPGFHETLFPALGPTRPVLGAMNQFGLLLLMFCSGTEVRSNLDPSERRSTMAVASVGTVVPFAVAIALLGSWDFEALLGPAAHVGAFALVFGIALAVTSIPVISRIMMDLRVIETSFARVVLGAAIVEDILLYAVLSVALGLVGGVATVDSAVPALLGLEGNQGALVAYHGGVSVLFLALALWLGGRSLQALLAGPLGWLHRSSPAGALLAVLLATTGLAVGLGIAPMFGAFVAGLVVGRTRLLSATGLPAIREMSMAFFVPVYFAIVGLRIDLFGGFAVRGFLLFLAVACVAKAASVYAAARWAKEPHPTALNLAVAMNARGGPCIVLASVALDAQIISMQFYSYLILLALVTSSVAGSWLAHRLRGGLALR